MNKLMTKAAAVSAIILGGGLAVSPSFAAYTKCVQNMGVDGDGYTTSTESACAAQYSTANQCDRNCYQKRSLIGFKCIGGGNKTRCVTPDPNPVPNSTQVERRSGVCVRKGVYPFNPTCECSYNVSWALSNGADGQPEMTSSTKCSNELTQ